MQFLSLIMADSFMMSARWVQEGSCALQRTHVEVFTSAPERAGRNAQYPATPHPDITNISDEMFNEMVMIYVNEDRRYKALRYTPIRKGKMLFRGVTTWIP